MRARLKRTAVVGLVVAGTLSYGVAASAADSQHVDTACTDCALLAPAGDDVTPAGDFKKRKALKKPKDKLV